MCLLDLFPGGGGGPFEAHTFGGKLLLRVQMRKNEVTIKRRKSI